VKLDDHTPMLSALTASQGVAAAPCFVRLVYSHMPDLLVTVDGRPVESWRTLAHFVALPLEAGRHDIVLRPSLSRWRRVLMVAGLLVVVAVGLILGSSRRSYGLGQAV
jgi:hypothetical protein